MRRDSIFYQLFQQSPNLVFELLTNPPFNDGNYRFDSVAVKEPKFEIDGVFLPPESEGVGVVYFCEVQFQKDDLKIGEPFWMSEIGLGIGRCRLPDDPLEREVLSWYNASGDRYLSEAEVERQRAEQLALRLRQLEEEL